LRVVTCRVSRFLVHKTSLCAAGEDEVASSLGGYIWGTRDFPERPGARIQLARWAVRGIIKTAMPEFQSTVRTFWNCSSSWKEELWGRDSQ
jgi:hypothetical protein